jgi:hypothetical protein
MVMVAPRASRVWMLCAVARLNVYLPGDPVAEAKKAGLNRVHHGRTLHALDAARDEAITRHGWVVVDAVDSDRCAACVVACEKNHDVAAPDWRPQPSRDGVRRRCRFVVLHIEVVKERAASATARSPSPESTVSITSPIL